MLNLIHNSSSDFAAYAPNAEYSMDLSNEINQYEQQQQHILTTGNVPPAISQMITPLATKNTEDDGIETTSVVKENAKPSPLEQQQPGPIQRPPKLKYSIGAPLSSFLTESALSPSTPDVLLEINHLLQHQNSITTTQALNIVTPSNASVTNSDFSVPNAPWEPLASSGWPIKYDSSWPSANIQSPSGSLVQRVQNPLLDSNAADNEISVWPSTFESNRPSAASLNTRAHQLSSDWNKIFSSAAGSSSSAAETTDSDWLKFLPVPNSPSVNTTGLNEEDKEANDSFLNLLNSHEMQQDSTTPWWPKIPYDGDDNHDNDRSRWDFAR